MDLAHKRFGDLLREHRLTAGLSQEDLAERAALSAVTISSLERSARTRPHKQTIALLAEALRLPRAARDDLERAAAGGRSTRANESRSNNLPTQLSKFIGRERAAAEVQDLIASHRLVTLVGAAGVGKTRLALHVASTLSIGPDGYSGTWFVDLAPVASGALVLDTISSALAIGNQATSRSLDTLAAMLTKKRALIILDNCEHLVKDVATVAEELLQRCSQLRILATSREALGSSGERAYRVPSLNLPPHQRLPEMTVAEALTYDAIALFEDRAAAVNNHFLLTQQLLSTVSQICRQVDGIALAIELAAARVNAFSPVELQQQLHERFFSLAEGSRTALPRHRTMRALIAWSYDLLSDREQLLLRKLSTFAGGFTLELLHDFCSHDGAIGREEFIELLVSLVDKSLVQIEETDDEATSYRLLESTRQYAAEKLREHGEYATATRAHALSVLALSERLDRPLNLIPDERYKSLTRQFLGNWRAALDWSLLSGGDVLLGQQLAGSLGGQWQVGDTAMERRRLISLALQTCDDGTPPAVRARLELGDFQAARILYELGSPTALERVEHAMRLFQQIDDSLGIAEAQSAIGIVLLNQRRFAESKLILQAAITRAYDCGAQRIAVYAKYSLAEVHLHEGDAAAARLLFKDVFERAQSARCGRLAAITALTLAEVESMLGEVEAAVRLCQDAIATLRDIRHVVPLAFGLRNLAGHLIALNRLEEARVSAREALVLAGESGLSLVAAWAMEDLAAIAVIASADFGTTGGAAAAERSAHLLGFVDECLRKANYKRAPWDQLEDDRVRSVLRAAFGTRFEKLLQTGSEWPESHAFSEALEV